MLLAFLISSFYFSPYSASAAECTDEGGRGGILLAVVAVPKHPPDNASHLMSWLAVVNRVAYAQAQAHVHGPSDPYRIKGIYVSSTPLSSRWAKTAFHHCMEKPAPSLNSLILNRKPAWDKILLAAAAMRHSPCSEWVWLLDADAFIMNLESDHLGEVIRNATATSLLVAGEGINATPVNVIVAKAVNVS